MRAAEAQVHLCNLRIRASLRFCRFGSRSSRDSRKIEQYTRHVKETRNGVGDVLR